MKLTKQWDYAFWPPCWENQTGGGIQDRLAAGRGYQREPSCSTPPCWQSMHEPKSARHDNILGPTLQTSGSDSRLSWKSGFESWITFGWSWTPWRRFAQSKHNLVNYLLRRLLKNCTLFFCEIGQGTVNDNILVINSRNISKLYAGSSLSDAWQCCSLDLSKWRIREI